MRMYRIQFKLMRLTDVSNPLSWFFQLSNHLADQLFISRPMYDSDDGEWSITKLVIVKERTEIWIDIVLDAQCWVWLRLRGKGNRPSAEALEKAMEWEATVAEVIEKNRRLFLINHLTDGSKQGR